jgi:hypothetical protein
MWVVIYEKSTSDHIHRIHRVIEADAMKWTFEGGIRDGAREALAALHHEEDDQMEHSQYRHSLSQAREGADAVVIPTEGHDHIGCLADQLKLTRASVRDLNEAMKKIQQLGNHGEEASWRITKLKAMCKKKEDAAKKLKEEKANLEGMIQSHDELIMGMADEYGLNCMGENDDHKNYEEDDGNDKGDAAAPPPAAPPPIATPLAAAPEVIVIEENPMEMIPE